jgi:hypothetical protein
MNIYSALTAPSSISPASGLRFGGVFETRSSQNAVPGACAPVRNLFHVSQALSWIAGTRNTIQERLEYVKAIPQLMGQSRKLAKLSGW